MALRPLPLSQYLLQAQRVLQKHHIGTLEIIRHNSNKTPETRKSRILEKPTRFNPPSHGSRKVRPRSYPGIRLSDEELEQQKTKRYPNMMPPDGTWGHWFLTSKWIHLWIALSVLCCAAGYSLFLSFVNSTEFRDQLPSSSDVVEHPLRSFSQFIQVYKMHTQHMSEKNMQRRMKKIDDARKRKEFLREHGVEPAFLTGTWMDKFGTVEGDKIKEEARQKAAEEARAQEEASSRDFTIPTTSDDGQPGEAQPRREKKKVKMWFGIW